MTFTSVLVREGDGAFQARVGAARALRTRIDLRVKEGAERAARRQRT